MTRLIMTIAVLLTILAMTACNRSEFNATRDAEDAIKEQTKVVEDQTKKAEKRFDLIRKTADLPSCKDMEYDVKRIAKDNRQLTGGREIKGFDKREIVGVVSKPNDIRITCRAEAKLDDDSFIWVRYVGEKRGGEDWVRVFRD